jgi:hypothetical protein
MATMSVKHMLKAYEPRIAVYGASLHKQVAAFFVTVFKELVISFAFKYRYVFTRGYLY